MVFAKTEAVLTVEDRLTGPPGDHTVELFWHPGDAVCRDYLELPDEAGAAIEERQGWRSLAFGQRERAPVVRLLYRGPPAWRYRWRMRLAFR